MEPVKLRIKSSKAALLTAGVGLVVAGAVAGFLALRALNGSEPVTDAATADTVSAVGKLYILPPDESPTVAEITDRSQLEGQTFFVLARNGDILLVYKRAKLALLYRPDAGKLVNVGPVTFPNQDGRAPGTR